jgi:hypothetical protein
MANNFGTTATDVIAQEALTRLLQNLNFVKNIHTDFSTSALALGSDVITHIITEVTGKTVASGKSYTDTSVLSDMAQTDVNVTLGTHKAVTFQISDASRDSSQINLMGRYADVASYGLGKSIVEELLGSGTVGANGSGISNTFQLATSNKFTMGEVIDLGASMDSAGIPETGRFIVAHPTVLARLEKEITEVTNASFDIGGTILNGGFAKIRGFDVYAYNGGVLDPATTKVGALAGFSDSLALVTAPPSLPPSSAGSDLSYVTDAGSGLTIQKRQWYNADSAIFNYVLTLYLGAKLTAGGRMWKVLNK